MKRAFKWLAATLGGLILLLAIVIAGGYLYFAARIDQYTEQIEALASNKLGMPVKIGATAMSWHGYGIEVRLSDVALLSPDANQPVIKAGTIRVGLDPMSFIGWPAVYPADVEIDKPRLVLLRTASGVTIDGLPQLKGQLPTFADIADALDQIGNIKISHGIVGLKTADDDTALRQFTGLDANVSGAAGGGLEIGLSARMPEAFGRRLRASVHLSRTDATRKTWRWRGKLRLLALKLQALPKLAARLPIAFNGGKVNVTLSGRGVGPAPKSLTGQARPLTSTDQAVTRLRADLDWRAGSGGTVHLSGDNLAIALPDLFRGPIAVKRADVPLTFKQEPDGLHLASKQFALSNRDLSVRGQIRMILPADGGGPYVDINVTSSAIDLAHRSRYLPVGIMPRSVVDWVDRAVKSGTVPGAKVVFRGNADDFPFRHGNGVFKVDFKLVDTQVKFQPEWPPVDKLNAHVLFKNEGLSVAVTSGDMHGMQIAGSTATIPDLVEGLLKINGAAEGDASQAMAFLRDSPIAETFGSYIKNTQASGPLDVDVRLRLPLANIDSFKVHGKAHLKKVDVALAVLDIPFRNLTGMLNFSRAGIGSETGLAGRFMGKSIAIGIERGSKETATRVDIDGSAQASRVLKMLGMAGGDLASGQLNWHATVRLPNELGAAGAAPLSLKLRSDLEGLSLDLPAPFDKAAKAAIETSVGLKMTDAGYAITARYGDKAGAAFHLRETRAGARLAAGAIRFGTGKPPPLPNSGLAVRGHLERVSLNEWDQLRALFGSGDNGGATHLPSPLDLDMTIGRVKGLGQDFRDVDITASSTDQGYQVRLSAPSIAGIIDLPSKADNDHPYNVDLDRLYLDSDFSSASTHATKLTPTSLPPINFASDKTRIGKRHLGTVQFKLLAAPDGVVMPHFSITQPALEFTVYGTWIRDDEGVQHTRLAASMRSDDVTSVLKALDVPLGMTADKLEFDAELHWPGSPGRGAADRLGGVFNVDMKDGHITRISPGAGRLLALFSLSALPRRLLFNFGDVFGKGFGYDRISGTFNIANGNAYTNNFRLKSTVADVRVVGRIGLGTQDYDELVFINTAVSSTIPVAGALAGGPITGAALFLLTKIFHAPLKSATQIVYRITGPWDKPDRTTVTGQIPKLEPRLRPGHPGGANE